MKKAAVILTVVLFITIAALLCQFSGTDAEYSRFNTNWNGTSEFFASADAPDVYDYHALSDKRPSTLLVIAPSENFGSDELGQYIRSGNTIIIADQSGNANAFLASVGSDIRVYPQKIRSSDWEYKDSGLFRGYLNENAPLYWEDSPYIFVNRPAHLTGGTSFIETSHLSWIDLNDNDIADSDEPLQVYSIASYNAIENGYIIVISDPSIFINSMQNIQYKENTAVLNALKEQNLLIDQTASDTAKGGGIFGLLPLVYHYPAAGAAILAGIFLLCGLICVRRGKKR